MTSEANKLWEKYEQELKLLQNLCPHKHTKWMDEWWSIGHSTGKEILVCESCRKILSKR